MNTRCFECPKCGNQLFAGRVITENEYDWIEFIRLISRNSDPRVTLKRVQVTRRILQSEDINP